MKPEVFLSSFSVLLLLICISISVFKSHAQLIPKEEVQALEAISSKLNIRYWRASPTACQNQSRSFNKIISNANDVRSNVTCDCSYNNSTICHITNIQLKGLNLSGLIPIEFSRLTKLEEIDLTRNYINGSIPAYLSKIPLLTLALVGNRISGSLPKEIGQISTLQELILDNNLIGGQLPQSLGNLKSLRRLLLSGNKFTGTIPETFGNLKNLTDFRIDGSSLSGKLPGFIGNWTKITKLNLQGTSMEGPIPSTINLLTELSELRISDLTGSTAAFPNLSALSNLTRLALRNCLITGTIPDYIGDMIHLKTLDLSFNNLTGLIPPTFQNLNQNKLNYMFLTNNSLNGSVPGWIISSKDNIDISHNNFTGSVTASCQQSNVNLASSFLPSNDNLNSWCWIKDLPCLTTPKYYSLFINCGGTKVTYDKHEYAEDSVRLGPSLFTSTDNWALSSTGTFMGNENYGVYTTTANPSLNMTSPSLYQTARLSPLSLKYYGICMRKGSYTVKLHFAEIVFSNGPTFNNNGRRIFDVAIQGKEVLKDFNIMEEAGGAGKAIVKEFKDVFVNGSTLEIHLYWRGKGTNAVPKRGVYGPLISAITVTPNFNPGKGWTAGAIIGTVVSSVVVLLLIAIALTFTGFLGGKEPNELEGLDLGTSYFSLRQIKAATDDFSLTNKIGEGGFGPVYKGVLSDGMVIAVKQLSSKSKQGNREFLNEIAMISALRHPNLVKLHGCCIEGKELLLIYEYMENNSLARALFERDDQRMNLAWTTRKKICLGIAKGLTYLHEESRLKIVHRDIKATNVLLDKDLNAKISDFGLAKLDDEDGTHISTRVAGTIGYMAPEYAMRGYLTYKADVYSFGVVILEIVSGKSNTFCRPKEEFVYLLDWAYVLQEQGNLLELVDPSLGLDYSQEEALRLLDLALLCTNPSPSLRPIMSATVDMIEGRSPIQAQVVKLAELEVGALDNMPHDTHSCASTTSQDSTTVHGQGVSMDGPWIDSSIITQWRDEIHQWKDENRKHKQVIG